MPASFLGFAPLRLGASSLWMGTTGLLLIFFVRGGVPVAIDAGIPLLFAFLPALYVPLLLCLLEALMAYRREGRAWRWADIRSRYRLQRPRGKQWLWILGGVVVANVFDALLEPVLGWLAAVPGFHPPKWLPAPFNPNEEFSIPPESFLGMPLKGAWWVAMFYLPCLVVNIAGEEMLWRGYMLPRQELVYGRWAFLVNASMWMVLVHAFMPWLFLTGLPGMIVTVYVAQRLQSTWASMIIHGAGNFALLVLLLLGAAE